MVKYLSANLNVGAFTAFPKTMVAFEKNLIAKAMMKDEPLNNLQQVSVSP